MRFLAVAFGNFTMAFFLSIFPGGAEPLQHRDPDVKEGETTYGEKCAACHGPDGSSDTVIGKDMGAPDLRSAEVQNKSDMQLMEIINDGKNKMPAFRKQLDQQSITNVVAYLRKLAGNKER